MKKSKHRLAYEANKNAKVGENIVCPICHKTFKKIQYSQAFCCGQCKDAFWNAKGDRHSAGYYEKYNSKHPERKVRAALYSMDIVTARDTDEIYARMALANNEEFRRYVNDDCDVCDIPNCNVDLATMHENYLGID